MPASHIPDFCPRWEHDAGSYQFCPMLPPKWQNKAMIIRLVMKAPRCHQKHLRSHYDGTILERNVNKIEIRQLHEANTMLTRRRI